MVGPGVTSTQLSGLSAGVSYEIAVVASNAVGNSIAATTTIALDTTVVVTASATTVTYGTRFTLSAVVKSLIKGAPTGDVVFMSGRTTFGTAKLSSAGKAKLTVTGLPAGTYAVTGTYEGDNTHDKNSSAPITVVVHPASSTVSGRISGTSSKTILNVLVASSPTSGGVPSGTVIVTDGTTILGTLTLKSGKASLNITHLVPVGVVLKLTYTGDVNHLSSTGEVTS